MKKLIFLFSIFIFSYISLSAQWTVVNLGTNYNFTYIGSSGNSYLYATAYNPSNYAGFIYKSTNSGNNWTQVTLPSMIAYPWWGGFDSTGLNGIVIGKGSILMTATSGANWYATWTPSDTVVLFGGDIGKYGACLWAAGNKTSGSGLGVPVVVRCVDLLAATPVYNRLGLPSGMSGYQLTSVRAVDSNTCYISYHGTGSNGGILITVNGGANWSETPLSMEIWCLKIGDDGYGYAAGGGTSNNGIFNTTNAGASWTTVYSGSGGGLYSLDQNSQATYVVGRNGTIVKGIGGGNNWVVQNSGVTADLLGVRAINNDYVFAVGNNGTMLKTTNGGVGIPVISTEIPASYSLHQNYPNPFNPATNIKFNIAKSGDVKIVVFDVMGREVQTLVNESLQPGTYEVTFDGSQISGGVYFYRLNSDVFSETKRMIMIK